MNEANFPEWSDDIDCVMNELGCVTCQIESVQEQLSRCDVSCDVLDALCNNIRNALRYWCGNTYVGDKKDYKLSMAFQRFFTAFYDFLIYCKNSCNKELNDFAKRCLYQGVVYRYLGYADDDPVQYTEYVKPCYDGIYVSWSKNLNFTNYIMTKLQPYVTKLEGNISENCYGIDLDEFDVSNEDEVVFPTIESMITNIEYLPVDEDDDSEDED